jgi:hypothetical protein
MKWLLAYFQELVQCQFLVNYTKYESVPYNFGVKGDDANGIMILLPRVCVRVAHAI